MFHQTVYVANASADKVYVRATYEKWQQLKFSTEVKLLSGTSTGGNFDFHQASDLTEGYTALASHHTLKMIGSFFSAEADRDPVLAPGGAAGGAAPAGAACGGERLGISRNYRVPNGHAIIITPQQTLQVVKSRYRWKKHCREYCPFMFREKTESQSCWEAFRGQTGDPAPEPCQICHRERKAQAQP